MKKNNKVDTLFCYRNIVCVQLKGRELLFPPLLFSPCYFIKVDGCLARACEIRHLITKASAKGKEIPASIPKKCPSPEDTSSVPTMIGNTAHPQ